ncbi:hypothetical protein PAL_GLEAN10016303 [Pteropus alecto]|uniref:Uncharacterized protein n=1 Tax=Pteropus alecto TaxID=9402 RepID=L5KTM9_PTEAL|nr:hypothetical protein PAL_GLEAN10016303 [Pteropus alecto]
MPESLEREAAPKQGNITYWPSSLLLCLKGSHASASGEDTAFYSCSEAPLEAQMWAPQPTAERGAGEPQRSPF